ncbi:hypothetical protein SADUNF_Sadunf17G0004700 [Salix dunnii]|uniref:4-hydroxy-tetrahydrodipicolinate reductase n=1 Tax=Salix dunnii TaxID=1413687 RepID=A0A835MMS3_9ROSI|nr:hypothetical protein SADUNF_Sadunf17G0004700 [Salix dunnii]
MWVQGAVLYEPLKQLYQSNPLISNGTRFLTKHYQKRRSSVVVMSMTTKGAAVPIMVNGCNGKMGSSVILAANSAGLQILPKSFGPEKEAGNTVEVFGNEIKIHGPSERESVLASLYDDYPNMIVVDYTVPDLVNDNADLYCRVGVPFVMGTTGGDRDRLYKTVDASKVYAVISPQMGKQVVAFLAAMEIMAEQFPDAFAGYSLHVKESHQAGKLDTSGTAKAVISCFKKLGVSFDDEVIEMIRDPKEQVELVGVPEEYLSGHAFHLYYLSSPDKTVSFEFQHNVCGRSIYAEGTVDAVLFLAKKVKMLQILTYLRFNLVNTLVTTTSSTSLFFGGFSIRRSYDKTFVIDNLAVVSKLIVSSNFNVIKTQIQSKADKRIYNMIDVLREGNMR